MRQYICAKEADSREAQMHDPIFFPFFVLFVFFFFGAVPEDHGT
jgi:hypothetical protein